MSHAYTEDQLVEQPAIGLFDDLGWETVSAAEEVFGVGGILGRLAKSEVGQVELAEKELFHSNSIFHHLVKKLKIMK